MPPEPYSLSTSQEEAGGRKERSRRKVNRLILDEGELEYLAKRFADAVPEEEMSVGRGVVQPYVFD